MNSSQLEGKKFLKEHIQSKSNLTPSSTVSSSINSKDEYKEQPIILSQPQVSTNKKKIIYRRYSKKKYLNPRSLRLDMVKIAILTIFAQFKNPESGIPSFIFHKYFQGKYSDLKWTLDRLKELNFLESSKVLTSSGKLKADYWKLVRPPERIK